MSVSRIAKAIQWVLGAATAAVVVYKHRSGLNGVVRAQLAATQDGLEPGRRPEYSAPGVDGLDGAMKNIGPAFSVRPANLGDAAGAVDALRSSITYLCVEDHQNDAATLAHWLRNKTVEHFERWLLEPTNFVAVGDDGAQVCGVGLIDQSGHVRLCYVRSDRQRLGVGRAVLSALEVQASSWGLKEVRLTSSATARAFYEKQGYASDGESVPAFGVARGYPYRKCLLKPAVQLTP